MKRPKKCPVCNSTRTRTYLDSFTCLKCGYENTIAICVDCGTNKDIIYRRPGEERCRKCAGPIFEKMKRDREWMKEREKYLTRPIQ